MRSQSLWTFVAVSALIPAIIGFVRFLFDLWTYVLAINAGSGASGAAHLNYRGLHGALIPFAILLVAVFVLWRILRSANKR